jgi:hypothetical protein
VLEGRTPKGSAYGSGRLSKAELMAVLGKDEPLLKRRLKAAGFRLQDFLADAFSRLRFPLSAIRFNLGEWPWRESTIQG